MDNTSWMMELLLGMVLPSREQKRGWYQEGMFQAGDINGSFELCSSMEPYHTVNCNLTCRWVIYKIDYLWHNGLKNLALLGYQPDTVKIQGCLHKRVIWDTTLISTWAETLNTQHLSTINALVHDGWYLWMRTMAHELCGHTCQRWHSD